LYFIVNLVFIEFIKKNTIKETKA